MTSLSKIEFSDSMKYETCKRFVHTWNPNCFQANTFYAYQCAIGSIKYFTIFYLVTGLYKYKKLNKDFLKQHLQCFCKSATAGFVIGSGFLFYLCILRHTLGKFSEYTAVFLPGFLSGLSGIFFANKNKRHLVSKLFMEITIETIFRILDFKKILKRNLFVDTVIFMISNGYLLYLLRKEYDQDKSKRFSSLWIFRPLPLKNKGNNRDDKICPHPNDCYEYILKETKSYFMFGCCVQLVNIIIKNFSNLKTSPLVIFRLLLKLENLRLPIFTGGYVGLYNLTTCFLCKHYKEDKLWFSIIGGLFGGTIYAIVPSLTILSSALSNVINNKLNQIQEENCSFPFIETIFALSIAFSFHCRLFLPEAVPSASIHIHKSATNGMSEQLLKNFQNGIKTLITKK